LITQYFQFIQGYTPLGTGVRLLPVATAIAIASLMGTRLAVRTGNKAVVAAGLALWGATLLWVAPNDASTSYLTIAGQMIRGGGGLGLITAPATEAIMGAVPTAKAGVGSAVNDATRLFGAALGVAVTGSVAASLYSSRLDQTIPRHLPAQAVNAADGSVGGALVAAQNLQRAGAASLRAAPAGTASRPPSHGPRPSPAPRPLVRAPTAAALPPSRPTPPTTTQPRAATPLGPCIKVPLVGGAPVAVAHRPDGRSKRTRPGRRASSGRRLRRSKDPGAAVPETT